MCPRALKADVIAFQLVNQNPIGPDMAITASSKISAQRMILILRRQLCALDQQIEHDLQFIQVMTSFAGEFDVSFELTSPTEGSHSPRSA